MSCFFYSPESFTGRFSVLFPRPEFGNNAIACPSTGALAVGSRKKTISNTSHNATRRFCRLAEGRTTENRIDTFDTTRCKCNAVILGYGGTQTNDFYLNTRCEKVNET